MQNLNNSCRFIRNYNQPTADRHKSGFTAAFKLRSGAAAGVWALLLLFFILLFPASFVLWYQLIPNDVISLFSVSVLISDFYIFILNTNVLVSWGPQSKAPNCSLCSFNRCNRIYSLPALVWLPFPALVNFTCSQSPLLLPSVFSLCDPLCLAFQHFPLPL